MLEMLTEPFMREKCALAAAMRVTYRSGVGGLGFQPREAMQHTKFGILHTIDDYYSEFIHLHLEMKARALSTCA